MKYEPQLYHLVFVLIPFVTLPFFNKFLPEWFCHKMGWHLEPEKVALDPTGFQKCGECPRCGKEVIQDSQGNWF